jgi:hypothetical protein
MVSSRSGSDHNETYFSLLDEEGEGVECGDEEEEGGECSDEDEGVECSDDDEEGVESSE